MVETFSVTPAYLRAPPWPAASVGSKAPPARPAAAARNSRRCVMVRRSSGGLRDGRADLVVVDRVGAPAGAAAFAVDGHRGLALDGHAAHHARLVAVVVDRVVLGGAVVPDRHVVLLPAP